MKVSEEFVFRNVTLKGYNNFPIAIAKESLVINDGNISIVKIQDQKILHSWNLEHPHSFTSAVVHYSEDDSFYCIIDNNTLLKWSAEDETLKNGTKFMFQDSVFCIISVKKHKPIILFSSGKVLLTDLVYVSLDPIGTAFVTQGEYLLWADGLSSPSETKIFCLTHHRKPSTYKLHSFSIKKREVTDYSYRVIENKNQSLKCWCIDQYNTAFITVWSNGDMFIHPLHNQTQSKFLTFKEMRHSQKVTVDVINADHIAIVVVDSLKKETALEIWDLKFSSLKSKKILKVPADICRHIVTLNSSLFLQLDEKLVEIPFEANKSTLAAALGKSSEISSKIEYSWNASSCAIAEESVSNKTNKVENNCKHSGDVNLQNAEMMDTDEMVEETEILAARFTKEGSAFKTNNRESDLFDLLRFALRKKKDRNEASSVDPDSLLVAIFTSAFRESALVQYIKKLSISDTVVIMETLLDFLENKISVPSCNIPSDSELFDWLFMIMKSHTEALLLSKDKKKLKVLKRLEACLSEKFQVYEDYLCIQNMFHVLKKKESILPTKHIVGKYFVDTIDV